MRPLAATLKEQLKATRQTAITAFQASGAKRLLPFIERPTGPTRSEFERAFIAFCERFGLPRPLVNARVNGVEVDAFFPEHGLIVELDGWDFHSSRESFRR